MRFWTRATTLHLAAAGFWLAAILFVGLAAALAFPVMKDLNPTLPGFSGYPDDHWIIAAGYVTNPLFGVLRVVQLACLAVCGVTFLLTVRKTKGRVLSGVRAILLVLTLGAVIFDIAVLSPRMQGELAAFRDAAQAGDVALANAHRSAFDADHPLGRRLLEGGALCVLGLVVTGWIASGHKRTGTEGDG